MYMHCLNIYHLALSQNWFSSIYHVLTFGYLHFFAFGKSFKGDLKRWETNPELLYKMVSECLNAFTAQYRGNVPENANSYWWQPPHPHPLPAPTLSIRTDSHRKQDLVNTGEAKKSGFGYHPSSHIAHLGHNAHLGKDSGCKCSGLGAGDGLQSLAWPIPLILPLTLHLGPCSPGGCAQRDHEWSQ